MRRFSALLAVLMLMGTAGTAVAAEATARLDAVSAYVWRGITFNDGMVLQPSINVAQNGFGVNIWGNMDIGDYDNTLNEGEFSEVDATLYYGFDLKPFSISTGIIQYLFPNGAEGTREVFLGLSTEPLSGVTVGITGYYDFDQVDDYYFSFSTGYSHEFANKLNVGICAAAGYIGEDMSIGQDGGLNDYTFTLNAAYPVTDALGVGAFVAYTGNFDTDVLPDQDVDVYGGANITYNF